jgi:endo-1,4-beta-xylanase
MITLEVESPLRELAGDRRLPIGTCVDMDVLAGSDRYAQAIAREFDIVVAENAFKPHHVWTGPHAYDFSRTDRLAQFAMDRGMILRGHTLVWHQAVPMWLEQSGMSAGDIKALLRDYIHAIVGRYRGTVTMWDVVNEAISDDDPSGLRTKSFWYETLGADYLALAFQWAHEADPDARLFYNDYEAEAVNPKSDAVYELVKDLQAAGVKIHGIGLQCHLINGWRAEETHRANIRRFVDLGLEWQVTEADVRIQLDGNQPTEAQLRDQAAAYRDLIELCLSEPACTGFLFWGFTDRYSWIPGFRKGWGAALPFDEEYRPKPAFYAVAEALRQG